LVQTLISFFSSENLKIFIKEKHKGKRDETLSSFQRSALQKKKLFPIAILFDFTQNRIIRRIITFETGIPTLTEKHLFGQSFCSVLRKELNILFWLLFTTRKQSSHTKGSAKAFHSKRFTGVFGILGFRKR